MSERLDLKALRSLSKWLGRDEDDGALVDAAADEVEQLRATNAAVHASYVEFQSTHDLHELARAVGNILGAADE